MILARHWLVPAVARIRQIAGKEVLLILLFDAYDFSEALHPERQASEEQAAVARRAWERWVVRHAPLLRLLTAAPPVLLAGVRSCFRSLLWGHAEMRADRELRHTTALGRSGWESSQIYT